MTLGVIKIEVWKYFQSFMVHILSFYNTLGLEILSFLHVFLREKKLIEWKFFVKFS